MAKATIIEDLGEGQYTIQRNWAGREAIERKFIAYINAAVELDAKFETMPVTTDEELFQKNIVRLKVISLLKKAEYLENNMPVDAEVNAWCADYTEGLTGEVGTIDIAGEYTSDVNIQPGYIDEDKLAEEIEEIEAEIIIAENELDGIPLETPEMVQVQEQIVWRTIQWEAMPETTPEEIATKAESKRIIDDLAAEYALLSFEQEQLWAAANRRLQSLEQTLICLRYPDIHYCYPRDGELYPAIALGPWTSFLNQCIYPGWQKFAPLHRYGIIAADSIDYENNTCTVVIQPAFSTHQYLNVNQGDTLGVEPADGAVAGTRNIDIFEAKAEYAHSGFVDFVERYPSHPISNITRLAPPIYLTDEAFIQLLRICRHVDYNFNYDSDESGYEVSDHWDVMYDIGDPWYWTPISPKTGIHRPEDIAEIRANPPAQTEFFFGDVPLEYDNIRIAGMQTATAKDYLDYGTYLESNVDLQVQADRLNPIGPRALRLGDCEDFVLTKMQMIIEAGIIPAENLQIMLCWIVNAGSFSDWRNWTVIGTNENLIQRQGSDSPTSTYHAVLGIQTVNRGFLISDQRDYGQLWEIEQLKDTHIWDVMSVSSA